MLDCVEVRIHESAEEFRAIAEPLYRRDPVTNTIELTLLRADRFGDDALLLTVWEDGTAVGAALQTPPYPLACNGIPIEVHAVVATELARIRPGLTGVRGKRDMALAFADAWHAATGLAGTVTTEERLYRLGMLQPPAGVCGAHREAADADRHCSSTGWSSSSSRRSATSATTPRADGSSTTRTPSATASCSGTTTALR